MSDISPEDRERLAKTKFGEWFDEMWDRKFSEAFDKSLSEARSKPPAPEQGQQQQPQQGQQHQPQRQNRRRSLLEESLSQVFGF